MARNFELSDLNQMTVSELEEIRDAAESKRRDKLQSAKDTILAEAREKLAQLGLTLEGVMPLPSKDDKSQKVRKKASAKFRNPETQETWSGRGREPAWIKGKDRSEFALKRVG